MCPYASCSEYLALLETENKDYTENMSLDARIDLGVITDSPEVLKRCRWVCSEFNYTLVHWTTLETFLESPEQPKMVIAAAAAASKEAAAESAQAVKFKCRDNSFLVCVVPDKLGRDVASFVKMSGANLILLEDELYKTSKFEYACTQTLKADFLPIKVADLMPNKTVDFDIYHLMPLRGKFIRFAVDGSEITAEKIAKSAEVGELYIKKTGAEAFAKYCASNPDKSAASLARRCRTQFLALYAGYAQMVFLLTDQSEYGSFKEGEVLLKKCRELASVLMTTLGEFGNAWEIVNNSTIGEFGSTERAPAIAAYAALFSLQMEIEGIEEMMIAALLAELGLILLPPTITEKIRKGQMDKFTPQELETYENYPKMSLDICLQRKLPVEEKLRDLLISTHERADGKGFPRKLAARKINDQMQMIHFCSVFDQKTTVIMGRQRVDREVVRMQMIDEEFANTARFSITFMDRMKKAFTPAKK